MMAQGKIQEKAFSTLTTAQAGLFSDRVGQGEPCLSQAGIIIY